MKRLLVASRTRADIDLPKYLGMYEFTVVPPSLFAPDGTFYKTSDEADPAVELRKLQNNEPSNEVVNTNSRKVIIIDGMAFVNAVDIQKFQIKNCSDFVKCFLNIIKTETKGYNEARIIFDRYHQKSLKVNTRANRTAGLSAVRYKVSDSTKIGHLKTKEFLSPIKTKIKLTEYLSKKLNDTLTLDFVVVYGNCCLTNISSLNQELFDYNQEEADTGIVLHALDRSKNDPFTELGIACSDTDVLLILLNYFEDINSCTIFKTSYQEYYLREIHESLKPGIIKALFGFHAFSGCDQTGKFHGSAKNRVGRHFYVHLMMF